MAPDSGLCAGGDRQRELFHNEVQGLDSANSRSAGANGGQNFSRHNKRLLYLLAGGHE